MAEGLNGNGRKALEIIIGVLVPLNTLLLGVAFQLLTAQIGKAEMAAATNAVRLNVLGENLANVNGSRFTSSDGLRVWQEIARVQSQVAVVSQQVGDHLSKHD